jgi:hypothetical protein
MNCEPISDRLGTGSRNTTSTGNHVPKPLLGSDTVVESGSNEVPQSNIVTQLDQLSPYLTDGQHIDLDWLLADSKASTTISERTQDPSSLMESGYNNPDHSQAPSVTSPPEHRGSSDYTQVSGKSSQLGHKTTIAPIAMNNGQETLLRPDATELERLSLLLDWSRRLGFNNLNDAFLAYYTSDLSASAVLSHEQSLNRVKQLPNFLSKIGEHSKHWPAWERANYVRETLASAEDVYIEECRLARISLANQDIGLTQKGFQGGQTFQITRALQQEVCSRLQLLWVQKTLIHRVWIRFQIPGP